MIPGRVMNPNGMSELDESPMWCGRLEVDSHYSPAAFHDSESDIAMDGADRRSDIDLVVRNVTGR